MERNTLQKGTEAKVNEVGLPVKAGMLVEKGNIVGVIGGVAAHATNAANTIVAGRAEQTKDNTGGADGAQTVVVRRGCFLLANDGTVTGADLLKTAYLTAQNTVGNAGTIQAGKILGVEAAGVWVEIGA